MKRELIYVETSVWNFVFATEVPEHQRVTLSFLENFGNINATLFISPLVIEEIERSQPIKREQLLGLIQRYRPTLLSRNLEAEELANMMVNQGMFPERYRADALHVSYAIVSNLDILVSWNFEHLVRINRRRAINAFCIANGYKPIEICTPEEVIGDEI